MRLSPVQHARYQDLFKAQQWLRRTGHCTCWLNEAAAAACTQRHMSQSCTLCHQPAAGRRYLALPRVILADLSVSWPGSSSQLPFMCPHRKLQRQEVAAALMGKRCQGIADQVSMLKYAHLDL